MQIELNNITARLLSATDRERAWLSQYLTFTDPTAFHRRRKASKISLLSAASQAFPAGFVPLIRKAVESLGFALDVIDLRTRFPEPQADADLGWLRDYQLEAVQVFLRNGQGILQMPTGGGKTEVFIGLTKTLPCRWLIVVPGADLLTQTHKRIIDRTKEEPGMIGDGVWSVRRVTVATAQTLHARRDTVEARMLFKSTQAFVFDEVHGVADNTLLGILSQLENAYWRCGVSATPLARGDKKSLYAIGAIGPVLYRIMPEVLIQAGALSRPKILVALCKQDVDPAYGGGEWKAIYDRYVVRSEQRNSLIVQMALSAQRPGLIFIEKTEHGRILTDKLQQAGLTVDFKWGAHSIEMRKAALKSLVRGDLDFIVCSRIFNQGIDVPELMSCINAAGGKAKIGVLQKLGRGSRVTEDKRSFEAWELNDRGHTWLERHSRARLQAYTSEGYTPEGVTEEELRSGKLRLPGVG